MSSSRFAIIAAVLAAFLIGVGVGHYVTSPTAPETTSLVHSVAPNLGDPDSKGENRVAKASKLPVDPGSGKADELVGLPQRFWTVLTIADERERQAAWLEMLAQLTPGDATAVRDLFRKMEKQGRQFPFEWTAFWPRWGEVDGGGALEFLKNNEWPSYRPTAAEMILRGWAKTNPASARAWLETNRDSPWYDGALRGYLDGLARGDLDRATNEVAGLGQGRPLTRLMEVLTEQALRQRQLGGMISWWESLPDDSKDGSARREAVGHVYWRLQSATPERAAEWLAALSKGPYRSEQHIGEFAQKLSEKDPAAAVEWVANLPPNPGDGHYTGISRAITALAQRDVGALESWLNKLPASPLRDQAAAAYVSALKSDAQRDRAAKWMSTIGDQSKVPTQIREAISTGVPSAPRGQ
jgi:hypothetical protein